MMADTTAGTGKGHAAAGWWARFCDPKKGNSAVRAQLRRCRSNAEVLAIPAGIPLLHRLGALDRGSNAGIDAYVDRVLGLARVLAFVAEDDASAKLMRTLGWEKPPVSSDLGAEAGERPRLSEVRFRRLLQVRTGEEQVVAFIRLVRLADGKAAVSALSRDYLSWNHDETKHRWAFEYYGAASAVPSSSQSQEEISA